LACAQPQKVSESKIEVPKPKVLPKEETLIIGAERYDAYLPLLKDKKVIIVANQTSAKTVDELFSEKVDIAFVYAPEHGFRGKADAGEKVNNEIDKKTGLPIKSLYGKNKKPKSEDLKGIDYIIFDIQDVGARFYTYISTLHYVMEAAAEASIPVLVLDRPNPNAHIVDGPVLEKEYKSFVGMHPIPVVHGMTIGEYAKMINGEKWLKNGLQCDLKVIKNEHYTHQTAYSLPIKPSPNLPNDQSINLYPSLCFFEGTDISIGRGTGFPFQVVGHPDWKSEFSFRPKSMEGAKYPKHQNKTCFGVDIRKASKVNQLELKWLIEAYRKNPTGEKFFKPFFHKLAGTKKLSKQIIEGKSEKEIRDSWNPELNKFKTIRKKYLLYTE
jgi:uncharacterized protein YbbC (DUF1343 family)